MSACGLAALNCARVVLQKERDEKLKVEDLVEMMMQKDVCEVSICTFEVRPHLSFRVSHVRTIEYPGNLPSVV